MVEIRVQAFYNTQVMKLSSSDKIIVKTSTKSCIKSTMSNVLRKSSIMNLSNPRALFHGSSVEVCLVRIIKSSGKGKLLACTSHTKQTQTQTMMTRVVKA